MKENDGSHFKSSSSAGAPSAIDQASSKCPECPEPRECPGSLGFPVSRVDPMSSGQGQRKDLLAEKDLKGLAALNACTARNTARTRRFQLLRDLKAVELRHGALDTAELVVTFEE